MKTTKISIKVLIMTLCILATVFATVYAEDNDKNEKKRPEPATKPVLNMQDLRQADADGDGGVTGEEFDAFLAIRQADLKAAMMEADGNGDGTVDAQEARAMARKQMLDRAGNTFKNMDKNGDGHVGKDEFRGKSAMFDQNDSNGDGNISQQEWMNHIEMQMMHREKAVRQKMTGAARGGSLFSKLDTNGDGAVDSTEAGDKANLIKRADSDGDGMLTLKEFNTFMEARKQQAGRGKTEKTKRPDVKK